MRNGWKTILNKKNPQMLKTHTFHAIEFVVHNESKPIENSQKTKWIYLGKNELFTTRNRWSIDYIVDVNP